MNAENFEPIRPPRHPAGNNWTNSGKLKRQLGAGDTAAKRKYQTHPKRAKMAKVPKRLRRLLDGGE